MSFLEDLPPNCPTPNSTNIALTDVWRFLKGTSVQANCFDSHAKRGVPRRPDVSECEHASCSLFIGDAKTKEMLKLQRFKNFKARAELAIPAGSGMCLIEDSHVHFWAYRAFAFSSAVVRVEQK
jgi:hypothetical protein